MTNSNQKGMGGKGTAAWEEEFEKLFYDSEYVDDRGTHWCVDGFVYKDDYFKLLHSQKLQLLEKVEKRIEKLIQQVPVDSDLEKEFKANEGNVSRSEIYESYLHQIAPYNKALDDLLKLIKGMKGEK